MKTNKVIKAKKIDKPTPAKKRTIDGLGAQYMMRVAEKESAEREIAHCKEIALSMVEADGEQTTAKTKILKGQVFEAVVTVRDGSVRLDTEAAAKTLPPEVLKLCYDQVLSPAKITALYEAGKITDKQIKAITVQGNSATVVQIRPRTQDKQDEA